MNVVNNWPMRHIILLLHLQLFLDLTGCIGARMLTDGTSVSTGTHASGVLRHGSQLPYVGEGYIIPPRWQQRQRNYGTDELVELLIRTSRQIKRISHKSLLGIADLSPRGGGPTLEHRSHYSGRDVDLIYYSTDPAGKPLPPIEMITFDRYGNSIPSDTKTLRLHAEKNLGPDVASPRRLDIARNWELVKTLMTDPLVSVQWIFVGRPIAQLLLQYAEKTNEPSYIIERAMAVMHQPSDAQKHMDHLHVRIFCSPSDRYLGCIDRGPRRWLKKDIKYFDSPEWLPKLPLSFNQFALRPIRLLGL